jgi:hypothetical protein
VWEEEEEEEEKGEEWEVGNEEEETLPKKKRRRRGWVSGWVGWGGGRGFKNPKPNFKLLESKCVGVVVKLTIIFCKQTSQYQNIGW